MKVLKLRLVLFLLFGFIATLALAQRPKIGLTLSGGGAKGLAHVGILQAIDSAGLKVDYITGTSMGSIIGAMYATGYSGNQIDSIAKQLNWTELLSGKPKYTDVSIEEKDEFGKYSFEIPMQGLQQRMGTGLIESEEVWLQFLEIFFHVYDEKDFSRFNIPFKCIATDLSTGKPVILESGEIVRALRSSMAIPSIFSSVDYDSTQLVDGGIVRNFPVSDVKDMGADYVIGVNLFSGLADAKKLNSAIDVMYQITNYRDAEDLIKQKKKCNILIEPPVSEYSAGSFSNSQQILEVGYELREKFYPIFKRLADSLDRINQVNFEPDKRLKSKQEVIIDSFKVTGLVSIDDHDFLEKIYLETNVPYSAHELNKAFRRHYSSLNYQYIYYELIPTSPGHAVMNIILKEQYPDMFKVAFSYHSFTTPAIYLNYTMRNLFYKKSRSLIKFAISEDIKAMFEHRQNFGSHLDQAFSLQFKYVQQRVPIYEKDEMKSQYKTATSIAYFAYHKVFTKNLFATASFSARKISFSPKIASTFRFDGYNKDLYAKVQFEYNSINREFLPTKGMHALVTAGVEFNRKFKSFYSGNDSIFDTEFTIIPKDPLLRFDLNIAKYLPINSKFSALTNMQGGMLFDDKNFYLDNFLLGGNQKLYLRQQPFVGYMDGQITATSFVSFLGGVQYQLMGDLYLQGKANIGIYNFFSSVDWNVDVNNKFISGFSAVIAYNLSMLPFEFSVNYSPEITTLFSHIRIGFIF